LHKAGVGGFTAYAVRGMSGETSTFLYSKRPFEINHLPEAVKLELLCTEESVDGMVQLIARAARTGDPGDGMIAVQDVERMQKIREAEL
ncbi:MAG TPA: P-II family nitrogen regulator, partial [Candidatus Binatia bacterium]